MANTAQARKRARQSQKRRLQNNALRSSLRTAIKSVRKSIATGNQAEAQSSLRKATSVIDRIADKGIVHKNTASRYKSRLTHRVKAIAA